MKLVGYRTAGGGGIGRLDGESKLVPLGSVEQFWADPAQAILRSSETVLSVGELSLAPPLPDAARVLCVGLNYPEHVAEGTFQRPGDSTRSHRALGERQRSDPPRLIGRFGEAVRAWGGLFPGACQHSVQ